MPFALETFRGLKRKVERMMEPVRMLLWDRFALDLSRVRYLTPNEANDELFFTEETRQSRTDNTFSFKFRCFEAPLHLPNRQIAIRFQRLNPSDRLVVYHKCEGMGEDSRL